MEYTKMIKPSLTEISEEKRNENNSLKAYKGSLIDILYISILGGDDEQTPVHNKD